MNYDWLDKPEINETGQSTNSLYLQVTSQRDSRLIWTKNSDINSCQLPRTMSGEKEGSEVEKATQDAHENEHDSESDDEMILEESPCGRWQKRKEEVQQQEVPGIDQAFLAMDTEEGVEVVWNEVQFSEKKKKLNAKQEEIKQVFDNLINLEHANIAKLHKYWFDNKSPNPRIIFITEYMSSGSLKNFLMKAPKRSIKTWKRWTTQILSALSYLHGCEPPIIHGNLTLDMIFLQHIAPEYETPSQVSSAVDIYSFGICALGMLTKVLPLSSDGKEAPVLSDIIQKAVDSIEDPLLKQFVTVCLNKDPKQRPTARELLFHPALFEIHALKLVAAHSFVQYLSKIPNENIREELQQSMRVAPSAIIAEIKHTGEYVWVNFLSGSFECKRNGSPEFQIIYLKLIHQLYLYICIGVLYK